MAAKSTAPENQSDVSESYISIGLGLLVVVVVGILLYNYFTQRNQPASKPVEENVTEEATTSAKPGSTYTVAEGDTLWSIAEKSYNDGFKWTDIAKANNLDDKATLEPGQQIKIPEITPVANAASAEPSPAVVASAETPAATVESSPEVKIEPTPVAAQPSPIAQVLPSATPSITGNSYTVVEGDNLWDIACRAYNDCYAWTKIAQANKLENPDLIHPGNVFTLPR